MWEVLGEFSLHKPREEQISCFRWGEPCVCPHAASPCDADALR